MAFKSQRRRRDLNPRAAINDLLPFQGSPFSHLGTSAWLTQNFLYVFTYICPKRREWDSNPRALADKRFSRPPRYDHFDTSPCRAPLAQRNDYSSKSIWQCQHFFYIFYNSLQAASIFSLITSIFLSILYIARAHSFKSFSNSHFS